MKYFILFILIIGLFSCNDSNQKSLEESFTSFVQSNNKIVGFGSIRVKDILNKADYTKIPKYGSIIATQLTSLSNSIDLDKPLYFAIEGPLDREGLPAALYLFAESKDQDSVTMKLKSLGYEMIKNEEGKFNFYQDKEFSISVKESLLVGVLKPKTTEFKGLLTKIYELSSQDVKDDKIKQFIQTKNDIVAGVNLETLLATSNTDIEKLSPDKKELIKSMAKGSFVLNTASFNSGELVIRTQNYFSENLSKRIPFNQNTAQNILKNLGSGEPRLGLLLNLDFLKLNSLMADFNLQDEFTKMAQDFSGTDIQSKELFGEIFNGQLGAVVYEETMEEGGLTPQSNVFVGLGTQGKQGMDKLNIPGLALLQKDVFDSHALFFTSDKYKPSDEPFRVAQGCEGFGSKPISGFFHLNGIPVEDFDPEGAFTFIEKIDYIYFEYGLDGGVLKLKAVDEKANILKQAVDQTLTQLSEMLIKMVL